MCVCLSVCVCMSLCVCACVRACVCACECVCVGGGGRDQQTDRWTDRRKEREIDRKTKQIADILRWLRRNEKQSSINYIIFFK